LYWDLSRSWCIKPPISRATRELCCQLCICNKLSLLSNAVLAMQMLYSYLIPSISKIVSPSSVNLLIIIRPHTFQIINDLSIISANYAHRVSKCSHHSKPYSKNSKKLTMFRIPPITPPIVIRKRSLQPLQRHVSRAHNSLSHIIKTMNHMPMMILRQTRIRSQARVCLHDGEETMQLMRHGSREDGLVGPDDWCWEIVVLSSFQAVRTSLRKNSEVL
jgi:hypothetical protein